MLFSRCVCTLVLVAVLVSSADGRKTSPSRKRPSTNWSRGITKPKTTRAPVRFATHRPSTKPHTNSVNSHFLDSERAATSHGFTTRKPPVHSGHSHSIPGSAHHSTPDASYNQTKRPIGFERTADVNQYTPSAPPIPVAPNVNRPNPASFDQTKGPIGFERINSDTKNATVNQYTPSAPPIHPVLPNVNQRVETVVQQPSNNHNTESGFHRPLNQLNQNNIGYPVIPPIQQGGYTNQPGVQINQQSGYINQPAVQPNQQLGYINQPGIQPNQPRVPPIQQVGYINQPSVQPNQQSGYYYQPSAPQSQQVGYINQPSVQPNQQSGYYYQPSFPPNQQVGYINQPNQPRAPPNQQVGYIYQPGVQPNQQVGSFNQPGVSPNQQSGYFDQSGFQHNPHDQSGKGQYKPYNGYYPYNNQQIGPFGSTANSNAYPHQYVSSDNRQGSFIPQNPGYSSVGSLGYSGFGSQPIPAYTYHNSNGGWYPSGSNVYYQGGESSYVQSHPYGGNPFSFTRDSLGSTSSYVNPYYNPNTFGYSSNPGFFGYQSTNTGYYGKHKQSRFSGLPIPIPIPIPIGNFEASEGGESLSHWLLERFLKNNTISNSSNMTTSVFVLNNTTVTPCTTEMFIYDSLNITVTSCTAANCAAIKINTTTNVSGEIGDNFVSITMCVDGNVTYSIDAGRVYPTVSELHHYWKRVCRINTTANTQRNFTDTFGNHTVAMGSSLNQTTTNLLESTVNKSTTDPLNKENSTTAPSLKFTTNDLTLNNMTESEIILNSKLPKTENNSTNILLTAAPSNTSSPVQSEYNSTILSNLPNYNSTFSPLSNMTNNTLMSSIPLCEILNCSWIEICMPSIDIVDRCNQTECPFTRKGHKICLRVKMCKSPSTPISMFASINTTVLQIDQFETITKSVSDVANLTLISYIPPVILVNCSQNATNPACESSVTRQTPDNSVAPSLPIVESKPASGNTTTLSPPTTHGEANLTTTEVPGATPTLR